MWENDQRWYEQHKYCSHLNNCSHMNYTKFKHHTKQEICLQRFKCSPIGEDFNIDLEQIRNTMLCFVIDFSRQVFFRCRFWVIQASPSTVLKFLCLLHLGSYQSTSENFKHDQRKINKWTNLRAKNDCSRPYPFIAELFLGRSLTLPVLIPISDLLQSSPLFIPDDQRINVIK